MTYPALELFCFVLATMLVTAIEIAACQNALASRKMHPAVHTAHHFFALRRSILLGRLLPRVRPEQQIDDRDNGQYKYQATHTPCSTENRSAAAEEFIGETPKPDNSSAELWHQLLTITAPQRLI